MKTLTPPYKEYQPPPEHIKLLFWLHDGKVFRNMHVLTHAFKKTPGQIANSLRQLKDQGCEFDEHPEQGVRLRSIGLGAWVDILEAEAGWPFQRFEVYRSTASTQEICKRYAREQGEAALGTVVITDEQTSGRGRRGNTWLAPAGTALLFSFVGHPALSPERYAHTIVHDLFQGVRDHGVREGQLTLKWPNDLFLNGKKLAGILIERVSGMPVIGIGINSHIPPDQFPAELGDTAATLHTQPHLWDRVFLLARILGALGMRGVSYNTEVPDDKRWKDIQTEWRDHCHMIGNRYRFHCDGVEYDGECIDVDISAGIIIRRDTGEIVTLPAATTSVVK